MKKPSVKKLLQQHIEELDNVTKDLPSKRCENCRVSFIPVIRKQRFCSDECFYEKTNVEQKKETHQIT